MKFSKLYGFIPLGIALIVIVLLELGTYEQPLWHSLHNYVALYGFVMMFCIIGGTAFLIAGILSVGRQYLKHNRLFLIFSIVTTILVLILVISLMNYAASLTPRAI